MDLSMTPEEEKEMLEMFSFESQEMHQHMNELLTTLEGDDSNDEVIDELFRITHTLKGSAMGMGQIGIGELAHVLEDVFSEIKKGNLDTNKNLFNTLYKANDKLGELVANIGKDKKISHKGIRTKIEVILRKVRGESVALPSDQKAELDEETQMSFDSTDESSADSFAEEPENSNTYEYTNDGIADTTIEVDEANNDQEGKKISKFASWINQFLGWIYPKRKALVQDNQDQSDFSEISIEGSGNEMFSEETDSDEEISQDEIDNMFGNSSGDLIHVDAEDHPLMDEESRPHLAQDDEQSVFDMLDGESNDSSSPDRGLLDSLKDKVAITDLVQVPIRKLDNLMNQVGQLTIERDRLMSENAQNGKRNTQFASLQRITSDLQYSVMDVRLVQVGTLFNKFHRVARDVASIENKSIVLELAGTDVEIDRNILRIMSDSMIHLVRNAVGHGIESAEERARAGKSKEAKITLSARNEKDNVVIEVSDDGQGIDAKVIRRKIVEKGLVSHDFAQQLSDDEVILYIFETGFSNSDQISEVSGRGVGMDVVKKSTESIGGQVHVNTVLGKGTTVSLTLPSSMAVKGVLLFQMKAQEFAFALAYTEAVISLQKSEIHKAGIGLISSYLKQTISVVFFTDLFYMEDFSKIHEPGTFHDTFDECASDAKFDVIVVSYGSKYIGIVVDKLLQQKEIIEKPIPKPLDNNKLLSGTTILGNGNVCLVVDVVAIADVLYKSKMKIQEPKNVA